MKGELGLMSELKVGTSIKIEYGGSAKILKEIGRGGQGIVYLVEYNGVNYALKWYFYNKINKPDKFRENLKSNIEDGSPSNNFLWPQYLTDGLQYGSFGYLMELIPEEYEQFTDILNTYKIKKNNDIHTINKAFSVNSHTVNNLFSVAAHFC